MEVPCPLCETPLTGTSEDDVIRETTEHVNEVHDHKQLDQVLGHVRGIIRNLPTNA
jgi:predicted small metal-binding protein